MMMMILMMIVVPKVKAEIWGNSDVTQTDQTGAVR